MEAIMNANASPGYPDVVGDCLDWIEREMLPAPDGSQGVWERYQINLGRNSYWVRPNCTLEVARSVALVAGYWSDAHYRDLAIHLADFALTLQRPNGSFPFFRYAPPSDEYPNAVPAEASELTFPNDNGKIGRALLWLWQWSGAERYRSALIRLLDFLAQAQDEAGTFPTHPGMKVAVPCMVIWPTLALLRGGLELGSEAHVAAARRGLTWLRAHILPTGRIRTAYELQQVEDWRPVSSETAMALKLFAVARQMLPDADLEGPLTALGTYLLRLQDEVSGAIRNRDDSAAGASLQDDPTLTDLVYTDGYALIALQEAHQATGDARYLRAAARLADFLARVQCRGESPHWDGGWRGSLDARTAEPRGRANQNNPIDEGGMYSVYAGWSAAPIIYGLLRQARLLPK
jgi:hypothetical protein